MASGDPGRAAICTISQILGRRALRSRGSSKLERHLEGMNIMDETAGHAIEVRLLPLGKVVEEIRRLIRHGYRRMLVLGPSRSRRLDAVRRALLPLGYRLAVIDLTPVRSRRDLDLAVARATQGRDFYGGIRRLLREAQRRRIAIVFHNLDGCSGTACEDYVVYRVWMEARNHCGSTHVVITARDPDFVVRCFERYEHCRGLVVPIQMAGKDEVSIPAGQCSDGESL